jgi:hypothetical protein
LFTVTKPTNKLLPVVLLSVKIPLSVDVPLTVKFNPAMVNVLPALMVKLLMLTATLAVMLWLIITLSEAPGVPTGDQTCVDHELVDVEV